MIVFCRYPYSDLEVWLERSNESENYAGGSVVAHRAGVMTQTKRCNLVLQDGDLAWD
jgi:hypothetical protein